MDITTLIKPEHVFALRLGDKALLLKELAGRAAERTGIAAETIAEALAAREALGSTGVGQGVAIPHARIPGLESFFTLFVKLERPIEFAAIDERPVDLVFLLLIPAGTGAGHLAALAAISRQLRRRETASVVRSAPDTVAIYKALTAP